MQQSPRDRLRDLATAPATYLFPAITRIDLSPEQVSIQIDVEFLGKALRLPIDTLNPLAQIKSPLSLKKRKTGRSIIIGRTRAEPVPKLRKALAQAITWADLLKKGKTLADIAAQAQTRPERNRPSSRLARARHKCPPSLCKSLKRFSISLLIPCNDAKFPANHCNEFLTLRL